MVLALLSMVTLGSTPSACRDAYDRLDLRGAVELCSAALPTASPTQLGEVYRLLALSYGALGDEAQALLAFSSLLALDPSAELSPSISPKLRSLLERSRKDGAAARVT